MGRQIIRLALVLVLLAVVIPGAQAAPAGGPVDVWFVATVAIAPCGTLVVVPWGHVYQWRTEYHDGYGWTWGEWSHAAYGAEFVFMPSVYGVRHRRAQIRSLDDFWHQAFPLPCFTVMPLIEAGRYAR